jgi:sialate O-acetylesterase
VRSVRRDGARLVVSFSHAARLSGRDGQPVRGFEVAGADGVFHTAKAECFPAKMPHDVGRVHLSAAEVSAPVAVRYGWTPFTDANLVNAANLPASTFRAEAVGD